MNICWKGISEECFSFNVCVNASLKLLWALAGLSKGTSALGHSKGTEVFGNLKDSGTRALRALGHLSTWTLRALRHLGAREHKALGHLGHVGTQGTRAFKHLGTRGTLFSRLCHFGIVFTLLFLSKLLQWNNTHNDFRFGVFLVNSYNRLIRPRNKISCKHPIINKNIFTIKTMKPWFGFKYDIEGTFFEVNLFQTNFFDHK